MSFNFMKSLLQGSYIQIGDIVSLCKFQLANHSSFYSFITFYCVAINFIFFSYLPLANSNHEIFYAQIRGLLVDNFCEKSAILSWLIPTQSSPPPSLGFDPSTYVIGRFKII